MRLYSGSSRQFVADCDLNAVAGKMEGAFVRELGFHPSPAEVASWRNSLKSMAGVLRVGGLGDQGVLLEYQLPQTSKRLDFMIIGKDEEGRASSVIVELKQWEKCEPSDGDNEVVSWVGGKKRDMLHPAVQVDRYRRYLSDTHTAFYSESPDQVAVDLFACAFLHNYRFPADDPLLDAKFKTVIDECPMFGEDDVEPLAELLQKKTSHGDGLEVLKRVEESAYRPSKKLMDHVSKVIAGLPAYTLLDEQLVVFDRVMASVRKGFRSRDKLVILVRGGPGTGKSVIAMNIVGKLLAENINAQYATGSKAFTQTLRQKVGSRGSAQFKYFNSYALADADAVDVLVCDEAHRIRKTSVNRFTKKSARSGLPQIDELFRVAKVGVYLLDDHQIVRKDEIGSAEYVVESARAAGIKVFEFTLESQFRCAGSAPFVDWIGQTLGVRNSSNPIWSGNEAFDFRIVESPDLLDVLIRQKVAEGWTSRVVAGFCWPWSDPTSEGFLVPDVKIGKFARPWNAKPDAGKLKKGIPKAELWATEPGGVDQIGCIFTAQGFEFDYIGVIVGKDLVYDLDAQVWRAQKSESCDTQLPRDPERAAVLLQNAYRVLMTRGMKGCYVVFLDKDTERFFKSRMSATFPQSVHRGDVAAESGGERKATPSKGSRRKKIDG